MHFEFFSLEVIQGWIQQYGYWLVFFGIMLENAGIPLPGETITIVSGFLAGNGELRYPLVLICTIAGAILGDSAGYWLGRWGGISALETIGKLFRMPPDEIEIAREKFRGSADRAVFFGRFIAILRIFAGPMAGLSGMPYPRFLFFNATGAIVWLRSETCHPNRGGWIGRIRTATSSDTRRYSCPTRTIRWWIVHWWMNVVVVVVVAMGMMMM